MEDESKNLYDAFSGFGVPMTAVTQTFNDMAAYRADLVSHESEFDRKMKDFDKKMEEWMNKFESRDPFKAVTKKTTKVTSTSKPKTTPPIVTKTIREKELEEQNAKLKNKIQELEEKNRSLRSTKDTLELRVDSYKRKLAEVTPHLEAYSKLLEKKKKKDHQKKRVMDFINPILEWWNT